ncbi:atypical PIKK FRAP protein kinase [Coniophora puteana RWD-64-598 SS2]|uniref:Serine/threonine-protein kinase TOR n=1 Tax=Coniophora puteana (strain RWD-64-598) TaxID=741705 RepID=A0A5M3MJV4_CONPW|nr:atypical PIKK FRAP protein kinase [Coniophora puteana RWD-64-598 SS2]EIW79336.1 atypical PIKK FRAP protein kinase [Coniophora puteana RWD-64-598 SS2]
MASIPQSVHSDFLAQTFQCLKNPGQEARVQAAATLRRYVATTVAELPSDAAGKLWDDDIRRGIFDLMHSQNNADRLGGLLAIDYLLDIVGEDGILSKTYLFRFYNYVKELLPNHDVNIMLAASKTLGQIAAIGGNALGERFMDLEVPSAVEMLQGDRQESPRYAGVLILKELARNSPSYFYSHIGLVLDKILIPLRDTRSIVREGAAELLAACLEIVTNKERQMRSPHLDKILQDAQLGLKMSQLEVVHGSLLTYRELLLHGDMFMRESFVDVAEQILRFKSHRDAVIRKMVITLIPTLAAYDTKTFAELFLHKAMGHLMQQLEKPTERSFAFIAIGHTATAVGSEMKPFLELIMQQIKIGLQSRGKKNAISEEPIFQCVGMLASAVGPNLTKYLHDQLDLFFAGGLNEPLRQALTAIARNIPPLLKTIQDRLLDILSNILSGQPYKPIGAPASFSRGDFAKDLSVSQTTKADKSPELITLALTTLGTFDFSGHVLNEFVRRCALPYLEDDNADVRRAGALTCCRLFVRDPICWQASSHAIEIISDVLDKLLTVGIADPDASIRQTVLSSLHERFDKHLAQAENVRSIFIALNDEVFDNRVTAVGLIGRLAKHNPAYVMPSLRKALIQLLTELEYSTVMRNREDCTRLLTLLVSATQRLIKPYALPMLRVLLQKANDTNAAVAANVLTCLGELSAVGGEDVKPHIPDLMQVILTRLSDPAHVKRDAALHALGQLCSSTGYVITPLIDYPQLLPLLGRILRTESLPHVRREVVKVLGILGALDPYKRKTKPEEEVANETSPFTVNAVALSHTGSVTASDDYYQSVVISSLLAVLKDSSLTTHHVTVIEAIMNIFKTQGLKCVTFLPQIIPAFTTVARTASSRLQEFHLQQLAILVGIIKQHVRNYMPTIFGLVTELWENIPLQLPIVSLIEALGKALDAEFKPFLPTILPHLLKAFDGELTDKRMNTHIKIFDSFLTFGSNIEEYLHLVIPVIVKSAERSDGSISLRKKAIQTIAHLSQRVNFSDHASRIVHPLVRVLDGQSNELRQASMDTLCAVMIQLGSDFAIFIPTINKSMLRNRISHPRYESLTSRLLSGERLPQESGIGDWLETSRASEISAPAEPAKLTVNQQHLKQAWDVSLVSTKEDWEEWMHRLGVEFMRESPSHALRACMSLVDVHPPLAKELFNAAFISCWTELYDQYQEDLVRSIDHAITSSNAPSDLIHRLLSLAEFMEHEEKPLPIEHRILGECAMKYHAYAKALHYKELEFFAETSPTIIEALIGINTKLQQHDAAWGTLIIAREQYDVTKHEEWYERLGKWQEALAAYDKKALDDPDSVDIQMGRMRCLHALGEWEHLAGQAAEHWSYAGPDERREIAPMAAAAAWALRDWESMDDYISSMRLDSPDRAFYRAILSVHQNQFPKALKEIGRARDLLEPELTSFVGEGYGRSYNTMVRAQMLSELEEIIVFKQYADQPERQQAMRKTWMKRLQGCQPDVETWQRILQVRALVLNPEDDPVMWIKFANFCRKSDRMALAEKTINSLLTPERQMRAPPNVVYAQLKYMWASGVRRDETLTFLRQFSTSLARDISQETRDPRAPVAKNKLDELSSLLARCYFKQGQWQAEIRDDWGSRNVKEILQSYYLATHYDSGWYKAWHTWALANFEVIGHIETQRENNASDIRGNGLAAHIVQAVQGFFKSISLRNENALQDTLRLLTLWFKFGAHDDVSQAMAAGFSIVEVDTWLEVIPQIIARIQTPSENVRRNISNLLTDVGKHHPQALIYPLTVASKSSSTARQNAARNIMDRMSEHSSAIVEQAKLVSHELIRVAILWHEMWHEGLEEASRLYFNDKNPEGMIACLEPLHDMLERGPTTAREISFAQTFGRDLHEAREACRRYRMYGEPTELNKAWDIYYGVFRKVEKQLPQLTTLDLQYVSPQLLKARNLELAIPGTYQSGKPIVRISSFATKLTVIASKQRPRRVSLKGSDGRDYQYLLKGHEDLRQDERVMQLFSLVNTLLSVDTNSFKRRLNIQRYPVIPLAPNAGLLGWVQDSDTLHVLVRDYRDSRKVLLNIEYRLMLQMAPDYENLTLLQKVEVFEYALENTTGQDLYRVLWLKSVNSEHWLERRATYSRSLAVNSMVGHILGLGDRHPSNLLLERATGKVVHIDFGDCFEVAMHREKFPEKIPFRLTRMLTHAMEISGIEGSFRHTCEITMQVLRANKESLMAVLEAFVYDPLINWRLMQADAEARKLEDIDTDPGRMADLARAAAYPQGPNRRLRADENDIFNEAIGEPGTRQEVRNERALTVYNRVQHKLTGRDFDPNEVLSVGAQVDKLIIQATSLENLCQCFSGWCAFW